MKEYRGARGSECGNGQVRIRHPRTVIPKTVVASLVTGGQSAVFRSGMGSACHAGTCGNVIRWALASPKRKTEALDVIQTVGQSDLPISDVLNRKGA